MGASVSLSAFSQEEIGVAAAVNTTTTDNFYDESGMFEERRLVEEGYKIIQNRTIETDEKGKAQMILIDGTAFTIGPNSRVVLDKFVYNPDTNDGFLEMQATGLLRLVGGKVTKKMQQQSIQQLLPWEFEAELSLSIPITNQLRQLLSTVKKWRSYLYKIRAVEPCLLKMVLLLKSTILTMISTLLNY